MELAHAVLADRRLVDCGRVADVAVEPVHRIPLVQPAHHPVPRHLGDDRGGGDGGGQAVAAHHGAVVAGALREPEAVDKGNVRRWIQALDGSCEPAQVAAVQAVTVDGRRREEDDDDLARQAHDLVVESLATRTGEALGVVEAGERFEVGLAEGRVVQADGRDGERTGEAPAAGLVGAADGRAAAAAAARSRRSARSSLGRDAT